MAIAIIIAFKATDELKKTSHKLIYNIDFNTLAVRFEVTKSMLELAKMNFKFFEIGHVAPNPSLFTANLTMELKEKWINLMEELDMLNEEHKSLKMLNPRDLDYKQAGLNFSSISEIGDLEEKGALMIKSGEIKTKQMQVYIDMVDVIYKSTK